MASNLMQYNKNPMSLREGKIFIDGLEITDTVSANFKITPDVWTGRQVGERGQSSRWLGYAITGNIVRRRSTNWLEVVVKKYLETGATPEMTIQGIMNDENSDYYAAHGSNVVTLVGCVLTGDLPLTALDSAGQVVDDNIGFNAYTMV